MCDLARAHLLALQYLLGHGDTIAVNLGNGHGVSVRQMIDMVRSGTGHEVPARDAPRRLAIFDFGGRREQGPLGSGLGRPSDPISQRSSPMPGRCKWFGHKGSA